jgi:hypothetical protein
VVLTDVNYEKIQLGVSLSKILQTTETNFYNRQTKAGTFFLGLTYNILDDNEILGVWSRSSRYYQLDFLELFWVSLHHY